MSDKSWRYFEASQVTLHPGTCGDFRGNNKRNKIYFRLLSPTSLLKARGNEWEYDNYFAKERPSSIRSPVVVSGEWW